jgi:prepilin-type N-terminal cleavage/methylation domain-containing protein
MASRKNGFTLIEMSMVLLIISLLVGAIMLGQTLIRQAQLKSVATEYDVNLKALKEFRDKYFGLPGDITNAESIWGSDASCPSTAYNTIPKTATCNGDGNGTIGSSDVNGSLSSPNEWYRAWQQLSNAGLVKGTFTGAGGPGGAAEAVIGVNVPASQLSGAGWSLTYFLLNTTGMLWADQYGHVLHLGGFQSGTFSRGTILTPEEAMSLDMKIDDGKPGRGLVRVWRSTMQPDCTTADSTQDLANYNGDFTERACSLIFILGM